MDGKVYLIKNILVLIIIGLSICPFEGYADYIQELEDQIEAIKEKDVPGFDAEYFHDMGIVARKADEAELNQLNAEIVETLMLKKMDEEIEAELGVIKTLFVTDPYAASRRLQDLQQYQRFYQPTDEYLRATGGQAISGTLSRFRANTLEMIKAYCNEKSILGAIQAIRKTGLFVTNSAEEIVNLRELTRLLDCCLSWKPELVIYWQEKFKTDYEEGILTEKARLRLVSNRRDFVEAKWSGEWIYHFRGREGEGEGVSEAHFRYRKGEDFGSLVISASRVSSSGRINFPFSLAGDRRTIEVENVDIYPIAYFSEDGVYPLQGCRDE
ncbi:MAG: hypothetical protein JW893_09405 [Candidatus Omnitrophica bacterium]|nr:hypothetical protein [Candidatus Omnitrophota bacterium]